ncbi:hypothetical protein CONPUDRAFT_166324 [Coniophora puteana RWD-64-598 SS2]|uniref:Calcium uniporter protein, mitochondrial n=1 Tax=Coniophora puteana (strain RWD-64-598) TaxID=741705 RepID=A0A5M3MKN0_CONPW|nr:uncharacterized protein CONPUDRAFT_166324 [Coniophora puteana RWD-64-598 SS2]EIW79577.1 hypothetical protein CONPUDRAFT_166324 [Coniophora puteana RWD-64-598 SS2]
MSQHSVSGGDKGDRNGPSSGSGGNSPSLEDEQLKVDHSRFLAEAKPNSNWHRGANSVGALGLGVNHPKSSSTDDFDTIADGKGKLSPTTSHLFKLILPLDRFYETKPNPQPEPPESTEQDNIPPPIVMLLHPSQPLSHASRLIAASLPNDDPMVSFRSTSSSGQTYQWADSIDLGDFIKDAAKDADFTICLVPDAGRRRGQEIMIEVHVPTFAARTRYLRRRLDFVTGELKKMEELKRDCDREARRGAKRMALGGFGMLIAYYGAVARLTFWDYGWDVMEPITYLSGLSTVICGYLWFLYQGREVSYSSVLDSSVTARQNMLYKSKAFDIEKWDDLNAQARSLRKEISAIAEDYDERKKHEEAEVEEVETDSEGAAKPSSEKTRGSTSKDGKEGTTSPLVEA